MQWVILILVGLAFTAFAALIFAALTLLLGKMFESFDVEGPGYAPMSVADFDDEQPPDGDWILWPPQKSDEDTPPAKDAEAP